MMENSLERWAVDFVITLSKENYEKVVHKIVYLIPEREFYYPEIYYQYFEELRLEKRALIAKKRQNERSRYKDKDVLRELSMLLKLYDYDLKEIVEEKRRRLKQKILTSTDCQYLMVHYITKFHMKRWLLPDNELKKYIEGDEDNLARYVKL